RRLRRVSLRPVLQATQENREAKNQQQVREDRADECGLDHMPKSSLEAEDPDQELREIAERRLQNAGGSRAQMLTDLFRRAANGRCEPRTRRGRWRERGA